MFAAVTDTLGWDVLALVGLAYLVGTCVLLAWNHGAHKAQTPKPPLQRVPDSGWERPCHHECVNPVGCDWAGTCLTLYPGNLRERLWTQEFRPFDQEND